jgi:hypothetical protein
VGTETLYDGREVPLVRKTSLLFLGAPIFALIVTAAACSATTARNGFGAGGDTSGNDTVGPSTTSGTAAGGSTGSDGMGGGIILGDASFDAPAGCVNLQCSAQTDACVAHGKSTTTISGRVYDPAGAVPLYNVYVYIPNSTPSPILTGSPTCTQCEAPASGSPVIGTLTDAQGVFTLTQTATDMWGVPSGDNIPLVLQVGKWRRQITLPKIDPCGPNQLPDPSPGSAKTLRLPSKTSEGDMPLIAFTSGCDPAECFLRHIGIDDSEFVAPGSASGHVVFYTGQDADSFQGNGNASQVAGGNNWQDTYQWWTDAANLSKYDIVFNACECQPNDRGTGAYAAMETYLNGGGRVFATHYYYNWFAPPTGEASLEGVVDWALPEGGENPYNNYYIDQTFPKGAAFAQWLQNAGVTQTLGEISLADTRYDMNQVTAESSRWIYNANDVPDTDYATMYLSFNTPTAAATTKQCGRAVFSDVHLSGTSDDSTFPNECANADPDGSHAVNEKALEFLFFDLSSCVQDNTMPPPPPPPVM